MHYFNGTARYEANVISKSLIFQSLAFPEVI